MPFNYNRNAEYYFELCSKTWYNLIYRHYFTFGIIEIYGYICFFLFHRSTPPFLSPSLAFPSYLEDHRGFYRTVTEISRSVQGKYQAVPSALGRAAFSFLRVKGFPIVFVFLPYSALPYLIKNTAIAQANTNTAQPRLKYAVLRLVFHCI